MSIEKIKKCIESFLNNQAPAVLAIRGEWGVGKTYFWNKYIKDNSSSFTLPYSYVSLFGINDIEDFKSTIFCELGNTRNTLNSKIKKQLKKHLKLTNSFPGVKFLNTPKIISQLSFMSIKKCLICIDDFERKGKKLDMRSILGLITVLKEQKQCKIVLIFNDNELDCEDEYKKFREKVIDIELNFVVSSSEAMGLIFSEENPKYTDLEKFIKILNIKNIRILKKIEKLEREMKECLSSYDDYLYSQAIKSLVLFSWCYYSKDENTPDYDFVKKRGMPIQVINSVDTGEGEKKKYWSKILTEYEFTTPDTFDLAIAEGVENGYFDAESLKKQAEKLNDQIIAGQLKENFLRSWEPYRNSFNDNTEEVVNSLIDGFYKSYEIICPVNLNAVVCVIKELRGQKTANEIIDFYINKRRSEPGLFELNQNFFSEIDQTMLERFKQKADSQRTMKSLEDILINISNKKPYRDDETLFLKNTTSEQYYKLFKSINGPKLKKIVTAAMSHGNTKSAVTTALEKIENESPLNRMRVKSYRI